VTQPSLIVVGTGIRIIGQMTTEAIAWIRASEKVLYIEYDPIAADIIRELNPAAESLGRFYAEGKLRRQTYKEMVARTLECVRKGLKTCLVSFGHPGVFSWVPHEAIRQARQEGFTARMLPGISTEDCLFADLGLDPGTTGCQSYEAMDFLKNGRKVDPTSLLILWQIGVMGDPVYRTKGFDLSPLPLLIERLLEDYDANHEVIVYVAPVQWGGEPVIERLPLRKLASARLTIISTLCIPPGKPIRPDVNLHRRLKLPLPKRTKPALNGKARGGR
jgi:precorrin-6B methylase 1